MLCLNSGNYGNLTLVNLSRSNFVTIRSVTPKGARIGFTQIGDVQYVRIEDTILGGVAINSCSQHLQIRNNQFVNEGLSIRNDNGCTPVTNLDIVIDGNSFANLPPATWEGRLSIYATPNPSGIVISNNLFNGGGCSDGIQLVGDTGGVKIGPGNVFRDLLQGSCGAHVDAIQGYTSGADNTIEGNYFVNNTIHIGIYDGGNRYVIRNNVFDRSNQANFSLQLGGIDSMVMEHNTFHGVNAGVGTKFANTPNTNWVVQNNVFDDAELSAAGDQPGCGANCIVRYNLKSRGGTTTPTGTQSITGDAVFSGTGSATNWAGWRLGAGSPGVAAGNDGQDLGITWFPP